MQRSLRQRLNETPSPAGRHRPGSRCATGAGFAYVDGCLPDGQILKLCRLRFTGRLHTWGFAIWLASRNGYENNLPPTGLPAGSPEEALDCACGLYLSNPTAWLQALKE